MEHDHDIETVDLLRPLLPEAAAIMPYLERIDAARWYSNFGPLEQELRGRLAEHFGLTAESAITASSATAGLISVLRALNVPKDTLCLVPSWTFVATPASAIAAELTPYFIDVDDSTWALEPEAVKKHLQTIDGIIGAVLVVAPFGKVVDVAAWDKFTAETSIPVVIDAASGFDGFRSAKFGKTPVVFSLHATKIIGAGEGALIISKDTALLRHVHEQTNFGYYTRRISTAGINSKMSEYTAAVALAALDAWPRRRNEWLATRNYCIEVLGPVAEKHGLVLWFSRDSVSSTCNIRLPDTTADRVISQLQVRGIKARQWWDKGCHVQPAYAKYPRAELPVTNNLGASVVSLPFYVDIPKHHLAYVARTLADILARAA
ncbi:MAG: aminotransferase class I/II-fold pyridoxal phosphate-dependent enzyme [Pseudomonadota bacterium]